MTRCEYIVTYADFVESVVAFRKVSKRALVSYVLWVCALPALSAAGFALGLAALVKHGTAEFAAAFWTVCICGGVAFGLPGRYRLGLRRAFKQRDALAQGRAILCEFDSEVIRFVVPGGTEIKYPWSSFTHFFENEKVAVLFVGEAAMHTIPKRAMHDTGWEEFRSIVHQHAGMKSC